MMSATTDTVPRQGTRPGQSFQPGMHHPHGSATLDTQLAREDFAEEMLLLSPDDRITCPVHRRWITNVLHRRRTSTRSPDIAGAAIVLCR